MERRKYDGGEGAPSSAKNGSTEPPAELTQTRIGGKWIVGKKLGSGAFGDIYIGRMIVMVYYSNSF